MSATALDVARYFLSIDEPENDITNLKLQKLCAYAQAYSLGLLGRPIFDEDMLAWKHGPVIQSVYDEFKEHKADPIPLSGMSEEYAREPFDDEQKFVLELIKYDHFGRSAGDLRNLSHMEFDAPWGSRRIISKNSVRDTFTKHPYIIHLRSLTPNTDISDTVSGKEIEDALGF